MPDMCGMSGAWFVLLTNKSDVKRQLVNMLVHFVVNLLVPKLFISKKSLVILFLNSKFITTDFESTVTKHHKMFDVTNMRHP